MQAVGSLIRSLNVKFVKYPLDPSPSFRASNASMKPRTLHGPALASALCQHLSGQPELYEELGATDRGRLEKLLALATAERINLAECLLALFGTEDSLSPWRGFVKKVNDAAKAVGCSVRLESDKNKGSPTQRHCWFTGQNPSAAMAETFSRESVADIQGEILVPPRAIASTGRALGQGKRVVRFFVSYAHADMSLAMAFLKLFREAFESAKNYSLEFYTDHQIETGSAWKQNILTALEDCEFGLLLVSQAFLGSKFITQHELPVFVPLYENSAAKPVVPIALKPVDFQRHDLKGLQDRQVFRHMTPGGLLRNFSECTSAKEKESFVFELFKKVTDKLDSHYRERAKDQDRGNSKTSTQAREARHEQAQADKDGPCEAPAPAACRFDEHFRHWAPQDVDRFIRTLAKTTNFAELEGLDGKAVAGEGRDALEELHEWAKTSGSQAPLFCAVLGEYGIGKTTTLKRFTQELLDARASDPSKPLPIYIDLRLRLGEPGKVPTLQVLLAEVIERNHKLAGKSPLTPDEIIRLVQEEGAVIIFDGLDEKIVHLPPAEARAYIRELWKVLPPVIRKAEAKDAKRLGKLLISCRSHYFRDVLSQNAMLSGEDREGFKRERDFKVLLMLPFTEEQIRAYLLDVGGSAERAEEMFALLERIHNLRDLAQRPVLLSHITEHLSELENAAMRGEPVNAARLYQLVVGRWLTRDDGKHQIEAPHKRLLMEHLAGKLAAEGRRELDADELEAWLDEFLFREEVVASAYKDRSRPILKEDLRTATFVVRPESGEDSGSFRFAHTSLQEFFLACHLVKALKEGGATAWDLPMQTVETLDFVGPLLDLERETACRSCLDTLGNILGGACQQAALLAFRYWLRAISQNYPEPLPSRVNLPAADLEGWEIVGRSHDRPLILQGANLREVRFSRALLQNVDLSGADLGGAQVRQTRFLCVKADRASFEGADLGGLQWRGGSFRDGRAAGAKTACQWIGVDLAGALLPDEWDRSGASCASGEALPALQQELSSFQPDVGHSDWVRACAWSPDGSRILSGSDDQTLRLWDAASGQCLLELKGHSGSVNACAWSPDGSRILSGSNDNTLRLWDAASGQCLLELRGHSKGINACAWSPDGSRILSGSNDNTLRLWDAASGQCLPELKGHSNGVSACAWSPDGSRILSGSYDQTLRLWDAASGQCLLELEGHPDWVSACAWSPDGSRILSGSWDKTLRLWDAASGQCLLELKGHSDWVRACAWSPDGSRILSGSYDQTLRLWDAASGQCLLELKGHSNSVNACAWSPDGSRILSGSNDNTLRLWDAASGQCLWTGYLLPEQEAACVNSLGKILSCSPGAWAHMGWRWTDPRTGRMRLLPAEFFGPLPVYETPVAGGS